MTILNLTNQKNAIQQSLPIFQAFEQQLNKRLEVWNKLDRSKQLKWIRLAVGTKQNPKTLQDSKDPVMWLAIRLSRVFQQYNIKEND